MKEEIDFKAVAAQLANPHGEAGVKTAKHMNISNADMTRHAVDLLGCETDERVLEIGPGNGLFAEYVLSKAKGIHYTGADMSETMIDAAREINKHHIDAGQVAFEWVDGLHLPYADRAFNRIFTINTLYFWKNPAMQLAEIKRVLIPGGTFCLAIASKAFMETLPFTQYGFTLYSAHEAQELLLTNGFAIKDMAIRQHKTTGAAKEEVMREEVFMLTE